MTKFKYIISALFVSIITVSLPVTIFITPSDQVIKSENRKVEPFPKIQKIKKSELIKFVDNFAKFIEDRMPLKEQVFDNFAQYYRKNTISVDYSRAIEGNDGWLFLGNNYSNVLYQHTKELSLDENSRKYINENIKAMNKAFPSAYVTVLVCPDKHGIYWEKIPNYIKSSKEYRFSEKKIDNLKNNNINVIDLYSALKEAKKSSQVYYQTDTHWNPRGAEAGFREFYKQLSSKVSLSKLDFDLYKYGQQDIFQGDLTHIGGFLWLKESVPVFKPMYKVDWVYNGKNISDYTNLSPGLTNPNSSHYVTNYKAPNKQRVFWCGDSFSSALAPFITLSFENIHYLSRHQCHTSNPNFINEIKEFKPDIIVWETVERDL